MKLAATTVCALVAMASATQAKENLIPFNAGFELGSPAGWYMWIDEKSTGNAVFETVEAAHSGASALQMTVKRATHDIWQIQINVPKWTCKANTRYRLSFWAKGPGALHIAATDAAKGYAYLGGFDATPGFGWTKITGEFATTDQQGAGAVGVGIGMGKQTGAYVLDDFELEEAE